MTGSLNWDSRQGRAFASLNLIVRGQIFPEPSNIGALRAATIEAYEVALPQREAHRLLSEGTVQPT